MRNTNSNLIYILTIFPLLFLSGDVFAYKQSDLKKLLNTFECKKCELSGANLSGQYLIGADLSGADLSDADLSGANLSGADLSGADLSGAKLTGANTSDTIFEGSKGNHSLIDKYKKEKQKKLVINQKKEQELKNLERQNLERLADQSPEVQKLLETGECFYCDLSNMDLTGANLKGASLNKANLSGQIKSLMKKEEKKSDTKKVAKSESYTKEEKTLAGLYEKYIVIKTCYKVREGQSYVFITKKEMDKMKSYTKKFEKRIFEEYPQLKSSKDKIWEDVSKMTTKSRGILESADYSRGKKACESVLYPFMMIMEQMFPPTGEVLEKDF